MEDRYWYEFTLGEKRLRRLLLDAYTLPRFGFCLSVREDRGTSTILAADAINVVEIGPDVHVKDHRVSAVESSKVFSKLARRYLKATCQKPDNEDF
jgi:hypothetical protein